MRTNLYISYKLHGQDEMDWFEIPRFITSGILKIWTSGVKQVYLNVGCFNRKLPGVLES